ncbi:MAG: hypothetical protein ACR2P6_03380 [Gammaproteobacteria bacterium]
MARLFPLGMLLGSEFRDTSKNIRQTERLNYEQLQNICHDRLRNVLQKAGRDVPYYQSLFKQHGLDTEAADIAAEIAKLPLLTKNRVRATGLEAFTSERYTPEDLIEDYTGGTTGAEPMRMLLDRGVTHQREQAFIYHMFHRVDIEFGDPHVQIKIDSPRGWKYFEPLANKLLLSQGLMDETTLEDYIDEIESFQPKYLNALASTAHKLVQLLDNAGRELKVNLRAVLLGSEMIYAHQRAAIEQKLNTRVYSWYGHVERLILAGEGRNDSSVYYAFPQYGFTEIVDEDGHRITEPDVVGQLVGTGFNNDGMPLIRYATGDYGAWADRSQHHELPYPAIHKIDGREQEFVHSDDGRTFSLVPILFQMHNEFWGSLEDIQFVQPATGILIANVVPAPHMNPEQVAKLVKKSLTPNINPSIQFSVAIIDRDAIVVTRRGKKRLLIHENPVTST